MYIKFMNALLTVQVEFMEEVVGQSLLSKGACVGRIC